MAKADDAGYLAPHLPEQMHGCIPLPHFFYAGAQTQKIRAQLERSLARQHDLQRAIQSSVLAESNPELLFQWLDKRSRLRHSITYSML